MFFAGIDEVQTLPGQPVIKTDVITRFAVSNRLFRRSLKFIIASVVLYTVSGVLSVVTGAGFTFLIVLASFCAGVSYGATTALRAMQRAVQDRFGNSL